MVALALTQQVPDFVRAVVMTDPPPLSKEVWKGFPPNSSRHFKDPTGRPAAGGSSNRCSYRPMTRIGAQIIRTMCAVPMQSPYRW